MPDEADLPEGAELLADGRVRYTLKWPVTYKLGNEEQLLESVTLRRKIYSDNLAIKKLDNGADVGFTLMCRLSGLEGKIVEKLDDVDTDAIQDIIMGFSRPGRTTGSSAAG